MDAWINRDPCGLSLPEAPRELGLEPAQIFAWRSKAQQQGYHDETQRLLQSETAWLKRELVRVDEENAFQKKAAAYFAKQPK